jgi:hypothetical protein
VLWHVTDGGFDSVAHLQRLLDDFGSSVEYVIVKNEGRSRDFSQLEVSPAYQRLLALGGRVVTLPELDSAIMYQIDRFASSFWAAVNVTEGERALPTLERRRARLWLERSAAALADSEEARPFAARSATVDRRVDADQNGFTTSQSVN